MSAVLRIARQRGWWIVHISNLKNETSESHSIPHRLRSMVNAVITLIVAFLIWSAWPSDSEWVIGTLVGISVLFSGISRLVLSLAARQIRGQS